MTMSEEPIHIGHFIGQERMIQVDDGFWIVWEHNPNLTMSPGQQLDAKFKADPDYKPVKFVKNKLKVTYE